MNSLSLFEITLHIIMILFFDNTLKDDSRLLWLSKEESQHIVRVMRLKKGDTIMLTNGLGSFYEAILTKPDASGCEVQIQNKQFIPFSPYYIHIAIAPTKQMERFEWFLEKATEIGIQEITPLICEKSERTHIRIDRCEKVIISAMKQSISSWLPKFNTPVKLSEFLRTEREGHRFIAHCGKDRPASLKSEYKKGNNAIILIGPEGDFTEMEVRNALQTGYKPISLGDTRLRTETAGLVACHTIVLTNQ